jgi:hypothetical protein
MTPLDQKVVSQTLAKELVDNGIVVEGCTEFGYIRKMGKWEIIHSARCLPYIEDTFIPAPLLCELLEVLPEITNYGRIKKTRKGERMVVEVNLPSGTGIPNTYIKLGKTPANAAAKMAITLKQKGLLHI